MQPLVSVLLPYRNAAETLDEALESVLSEREIDLEIIAVNDGSNDAGPVLVERRAAVDPRIVPISTAGVGIARALSQATAMSRGEFVARMDADDVSINERLQKQVAALSRDPHLGVVGARVEAFADGDLGEGMRRYVEWLNGIITPEDHVREIFVESPLCHPSVMMRRAALDTVGGFQETRWAEDYDLWLRMIGAGVRMAKIPEVGLRWRHRAGRATFTDPRYALARFIEAKGYYLAARLRREGKPVAVWGAGRTGRRVSAALRENGVSPGLFVDIDPRKIGRIAQGAPIVDPAGLERGQWTVVVAVGARGARSLIRGHLDGEGFVEGSDYICAS
ncbi:glycosyltransferase [Chondromyces crocatus]|uniref:Glycosyl transferase family 2 n=1 Tax=Chondromyces crocatus TaxID=52 RepID=A0A0K1EDI8_CHOCO|nr:glycosyltransferase [Chondromyces crocatus]AKT38752.1 glycosyl transferase family 2 [Chondromyces crocatus]